eukprot:scaffold362_cov176-Amphora_coffeaeformis.AAC.25
MSSKKWWAVGAQKHVSHKASRVDGQTVYFEALLWYGTVAIALSRRKGWSRYLDERSFVASTSSTTKRESKIRRLGAHGAGFRSSETPNSRRFF